MPLFGARKNLIVFLFKDDDHKYDVVPSSQFVLARTALKNGQSHYYLNDRKINWTEATELLMAKGIDLEHNRFLILQASLRFFSSFVWICEDDFL